MLFLAAAAGPLTFVASHAGRPDAADLYLVLETPFAKNGPLEPSSFGAREVGPVNGLVARLIYAPVSAHVRLQAAGHVMLPAGLIAALCGIQVNPQQRFTRS